MSLMRSERMGYYHIVMSRENAWEIMNELGELSAVEFVDLNQNEQVLTRPYSTYIKRCEEIELKIQSMEQTMLKFNRPIERCTEYKAFLKSQRDILKQRNKAEHTYLEEIEAEVDERLTTLNNQLKYYDSAVDDYNKVIENLYVLEEARIYFSHENSGGHAHDEESKGSFEASHGLIKFDYLAGVIDRSDSQRFRRVLHRTLHGMVWTTLIDIETDRHESKRSLEKEFAMESKSENKKRTVFLIAYPRGESNIVKEKLHKITDSFGANKYGIPTDKPSFESRIAELQTQRREKFKILGVTREHIELQLESLLLPNLQNETWPAIENYRLFVLKEKTTYHNLNKLKEQNSILQGALWCPTLLEDEVRKTLDDLANSKPHITKPEFSFAEKPERVQPPTYFRTNDFSAPFQEIVNTYGVPRYREVNPGLFTIASFPFLFGVMFGDIGHGLIIFVFGLFLCFKNSEILREKGPLAGLLSARYLLAMMGFFALYCGLIYNDFMALPLDIFGSCYEENGEGEARTRKDDRCVYSFGLDPVWYDASNELTFFNSFKMKMAIILGVSQMMLGTMLKMVNAIHFRSALDFFFEWMPQIVFLSCTFGYMVVLIFIKWATPYGVSIPTSEAPAIINIFINFALKAGKFDVGTEKAPIRPLYGELDGSTQSNVQQALLIISMVCVPLMLLPKPLILSAMHKKAPSKKEYEPIVEEEKASLIHGKDEETHPRSVSMQPMKSLRDKDDKSKDESGIEITTNKSMKESKMVDLEELELEEPKKEESKQIISHPHQGGDEHKEEGFGDLFVHQLIETIEFVLGSVSHTASYLRLWALSLAHSQLAAVFFEYTVGGAIKDGNFFMVFFGYVIFALITFGVLLCMDLMECFLHALRLHWVEFQSKFFKADGHIFLPFSFESALQQEKK